MKLKPHEYLFLMMRRKEIKASALKKALGSEGVFFAIMLKGEYEPSFYGKKAIQEITQQCMPCLNWSVKKLTLPSLTQPEALAITRRRFTAYWVMADFCKAAGIAASTQSLIEKGEKDPTAGQIKKYKELLNFEFTKGG